MTFDEVLEQVRELLQSKGRVAYRALKRRFELDEEYLEDLKAELIDAEHVARDEDGKVLVWIGEGGPAQTGTVAQERAPAPPSSPSTTAHAASEGERRQLTVMFIDLVGSTALSTQLDPEELREVVRAYQRLCATMIGRFEGHLAKYIGDGLLVYFGYPVAHEDDAQRAVRTGLGIAGAMPELPLPPNVRLHQPLQVRIGIHTGLVVAGEMGTVEQPEHLAIVGETPNLAARLQEKAAPNSVVISPTTYRLITGLFECQDLGPQTLKGLSLPLSAYQVVRESAAQSRFEVAVGIGLTPLVGREEELSLLQRRWTQAKEGAGQVALLSGEAGIGKSRLVQAFKEQVVAEGATRIEFRCSAYHQNSASYPIIEHLQRLLQFQREDTPQAKLTKLQQALATYRFPQADTLPLLVTLLSLPHLEDTPPLTLSPQKQKQKTQEALVAWIIEEAEKAAVYCAWEDLHWADPSTLEVLTLFLEQIPTARMFTVLTFRPDFTPPWRTRSHMTQLTLSRLGRSQVEAMVETVTGGKALPAEVLQQIISKTDGVPLFVEELTKMVLESGLLREEDSRYVGAHGDAPIPPLAIPSTLQDSLMARLDRLAPVREIAQVAAVLGREFSYELLHTVFAADEETLQRGLRQLVEAELIYQRGLPPYATYLFKHALIQDAAYQSLLKSKRQQFHQQIAQVLEEQFVETKETQLELLAHHYSEAGLSPQAIPYWQRAGQRAIERSANIEARGYLTKGMELLKTLSGTPEGARQELTLQILLGQVLIAVKGFAAVEVGQTYARARELCQRMEASPQLSPVLMGLWLFYFVGAEHKTARELGEQLLSLAQRQHDSALLVEAHAELVNTLFFLGEFVAAHAHGEQVAAFYDLQQHYSLAFLYGGTDPGVMGLSCAAWTLWFLGYPDQALKKVHDTLTLAQRLSHPFSMGMALNHAAWFYHQLREGELTQERAESAIALANEQGFPYWGAEGTILRGWALAEQGRGEEGVAQVCQGLAAYRATGAELASTKWLALLAEAYGKVGRAQEGLSALAEALTFGNNSRERFYEAELYRLKGELTLQKCQVPSTKLHVQKNQKSKGKGQKAKMETVPRSLTPEAQVEAEACFLKAIEIAQHQQAKSLELRATTSLARLWQSQGKRHEARNRLAEIYNWFTEGFGTKDPQEAKALLDELS